MMPAGRYYIGDLCYVMHNEWDEFCSLTTKGNECIDGEFNLKDGRRFATYGTKYGDGCYDGLSVDAGLIGCIRVDDIDFSCVENSMHLGRIVEFGKPFETGEHDGEIFFGDIRIDTGDSDECDPYYGYDYEDEE